MHLKSPDLDLKRLSARSDQRRMQRLVHVRLRHRDIILEPSRNRFILFMHDSKCRITILDGVHNNPDSEQIIDLIDRLVLILHLLINREEMFCTSRNLCLDTGLLNLRTYFFHKTLHIFIPHILAQSDFLHQIIVSLRLQILQRQIIQLNLNLADTKTLCDRTINLLRLTRDTDLRLARLILKRPHIVQTIRKLDHDNTDILCHREKHLSKILGLHLKAVRILIFRILDIVRQMQMLQLGHTINK